MTTHRNILQTSIEYFPDEEFSDNTPNEEGNKNPIESKDDLGNEDVDTVEEPIEKLDSPLNEDIYSRYEQLVKLGLIGDDIVTVTTSEGEIPIKEFLTSEEKLKEFVEAYKKQKQSSQGKLIDVSTLNEFTAKIVETIVEGGDLNNILESYANKKVIDEKIDISTEEGQKLAVIIEYQYRGMSDEDIDILIQGLINKGTLSDRANQCYDAILKRQDETVEKEKNRVLDEKEKAKKAHETLVNGVKESLKSKSIKDSTIRNLVNKYFEIDKNTGLYNIDIVYTDSLKDPKLAADLILFLDNPEEFKRTLVADVDNKLKLDMVATAIKSTSGQGSGITLNLKNRAQSSGLSTTDTPKVTQPREKQKNMGDSLYISPDKF